MIQDGPSTPIHISRRSPTSIATSWKWARPVFETSLKEGCAISKHLKLINTIYPREIACLARRTLKKTRYDKSWIVLLLGVRRPRMRGISSSVFVVTVEVLVSWPVSISNHNRIRQWKTTHFILMIWSSNLPTNNGTVQTIALATSFCHILMHQMEKIWKNARLSSQVLQGLSETLRQFTLKQENLKRCKKMQSISINMQATWFSFAVLLNRAESMGIVIPQWYNLASQLCQFERSHIFIISSYP